MFASRFEKKTLKNLEGIVDCFFFFFTDWCMEQIRTFGEVYSLS